MTEKRDVLLTESREIAYRQLEGVKQSGSLAAEGWFFSEQGGFPILSDRSRSGLPTSLFSLNQLDELTWFYILQPLSSRAEVYIKTLRMHKFQRQLNKFSEHSVSCT